MKKFTFRKLLLATIGSALITLFQNCTHEFKVSPTEDVPADSLANTDTDGANFQEPPPNLPNDPIPPPTDSDPIVKILITKLPTDQAAIYGQSATFSVQANSSTNRTVSYQWRVNGTELVGETSANLILKNLSTTQANSRFSVQITDGQNQLTTNEAVLKVFSDDTIGIPVVDSATPLDPNGLPVFRKVWQYTCFQ